MAQSAEHILGKDEVPGSNPGSSSREALKPFGFRASLFSKYSFDAGTCADPGVIRWRG